MSEGSVPVYVPDYGAEAERLTPIHLPETHAAYRIVLPGVMQTGVDTVVAMSRKSSLWPMTFGLACCAVAGRSQTSSAPTTNRPDRTTRWNQGAKRDMTNSEKS